MTPVWTVRTSWKSSDFEVWAWEPKAHSKSKFPIRIANWHLAGWHLTDKRTVTRVPYSSTLLDKVSSEGILAGRMLAIGNRQLPTGEYQEISYQEYRTGLSKGIVAGVAWWTVIKSRYKAPLPLSFHASLTRRFNWKPLAAHLETGKSVGHWWSFGCLLQIAAKSVSLRQFGRLLMRRRS